MKSRQFAYVTPRRLALEFKRGLTMVGLARKYALTQKQVETWIRSVAKKRDRALEEPK